MAHVRHFWNVKGTLARQILEDHLEMRSEELRLDYEKRRHKMRLQRLALEKERREIEREIEQDWRPTGDETSNPPPPS